MVERVLGEGKFVKILVIGDIIYFIKKNNLLLYIFFKVEKVWVL